MSDEVEKAVEINNLKRDVSELRASIARNELQISSIEKTLDELAGDAGEYKSDKRVILAVAGALAAFAANQFDLLQTVKGLF